MADTTALAESAQALFCAIADKLGNEKAQKINTEEGGYPTYQDFAVARQNLIKESYARINVAAAKGAHISLFQLEEFLKDNNDWYKSSVIIAKTLVKDLSTIDADFKIGEVGWNNIYYFRGDDSVMGSLGELFKLANKTFLETEGTKAFGDINKWTPADMYLASEKCKNYFITMLANYSKADTEGLDFVILNKRIVEWINKGELLPLSLKQVKSVAHLVKVNFHKTTKQKLLGTTYFTGIDKNWKKMTPVNKGAMYTTTGNSFKWKKTYSGGRDIYLLGESDGKPIRLQLRHSGPGTGGVAGKQDSFKCVLSYMGSSALGGQVASVKILARLIKSHHKSLAKDLERVWNKGREDFKRDGKKYIDFGGGKQLYKFPKGSKEKNQYNADLGAISGVTLMNPFREVLVNYFSKSGPKTKLKQDQILRTIFAYVSSRDIMSARFVIAKD